MFRDRTLFSMTETKAKGEIYPQNLKHREIQALVSKSSLKRAYEAVQHVNLVLLFEIQ